MRVGTWFGVVCGEVGWGGLRVESWGDECNVGEMSRLRTSVHSNNSRITN